MPRRSLRPRLLRPSSLLSQRALTQGVFGSSRVWRTIAAAVFGARLLRQLVGRRPEHLGTEILRPGQFVRIEAIAPPTRRERRAARRASR